MSFPKPERFPLPDQAFSLSSRALGHPARLNILRQLADGRSRCVREISKGLPLSQPAVSGHLKILTNAGFLNVEERGLYNYYSMDKDVLRSFRVVVDSYLAAVSE